MVSPQKNMNQDFIPLCVPEIRGNEWQYIKECLDTKLVSSVGTFVNRFESELTSIIGTKYAVALVNGTSALHIALLVAGIQPEDEVLVSTLTFIAPVNAIRYVGAWPVFIDAEADYWQMDPQKVVDFLSKECSWNNGELRNKVTGRRVKAILPVHILGHPVDMDPILEVAQKYNLVIIEDATESLGAKYKERMVGHIGDIACFSFNGNKIVTSGGGGMIVTDKEAWAYKAKYLTTQAKDDPIEYIHNEMGYNYRLSNIQAAMGCAQLEQLDNFIAAKCSIASYYTASLKDVPGITPMRKAEWASSVFWMYTLLIDELEFGINSRKLLKKLEQNKIQTRPIWQPIHLSKVYKMCQAYFCDVADRLSKQSISLPCSVGLSKSSQERVIKVIKSFI